MQEIIRKLLPDQIFARYPGSKGSLLSLTLPLIAKIASFSTVNLSPEKFNEVSIAYIKSLVENSNMPAGVLDSNLQFITCSPKLKSWYRSNYELDHIQQEDITKYNFLKVMVPCPKGITTAINNNFKEKFQSYEELEVRLPNGDRKWVKWESVGFLGADKKAMGVLFFCKDITQQHILKVKNTKLLQTNQLLQNFNLIFTHDLMQPMRQLSNFTSLLNEQIQHLRIQDPTINYYMDAIKHSLNQILSLSEGLALYANEENPTYHSAEVSFFSLLEQIKQSCLFGEKVKIKNNIKEDVIIYANYTSVMQLFQNLLANAVKYTAHDKPTVTISGVVLKNGFYKFSLTNNSIADKPLEENPLERLELESAEHGWVGLGLMICKKIVAAYKGKLTFKLSRKKGTTVSFTLPLYNCH